LNVFNVHKGDSLTFSEKLLALHCSGVELAGIDITEERQVADIILDAVEQIVGFGISGFALVEDDFLHFIKINDPSGPSSLKLSLDGKGITVRAVKTGLTQVVPNIRKDPDYIPGSPTEKDASLSELAVPVKLGDKVIAVINVESEKLDAFTEEDRWLIEILAAHSASALDRIRQRRARAEVENRFRNLVMNINEGIFQVDAEGRIITANPAFAEIIGYTLDELLQEKVKPIDFLKTDLEELKALVEEAERSTVRGRIIRFRRRDGSEGWIELSLSVRKAESGKVVGYEGVVRDVTEIIELKTRLREFTFELHGVSPSECYLMKDHEQAFHIFADLVRHGVPGLAFVRENPERLIEKYHMSRDKIILLSSAPIEDFDVARDLQELSLKISRFLETYKGSVILFDGLEYLYSRFGFDRVLSFLQEKRFQIFEKKALLIIPVILDAFTEREKALLSTEAKLI